MMCEQRAKWNVGHNGSLQGQEIHARQCLAVENHYSGATVSFPAFSRMGCQIHSILVLLSSLESPVLIRWL